MNYIINGVPMKFNVGTMEQPKINSYIQTEGESEIKQPTELSEALKELNKDELDPNSRTSSIDMRTILNPVQVHNISAFESLVKFGMLPQECLALSVQIKRNAVSIHGTGREQQVRMVVGKTENEIEKSSGGLRNWFGRFAGGGGNE